MVISLSMGSVYTVDSTMRIFDSFISWSKVMVMLWRNRKCYISVGCASGFDGGLHLRIWVGYDGGVYDWVLAFLLAEVDHGYCFIGSICYITVGYVSMLGMGYRYIQEHKEV